MADMKPPKGGSNPCGGFLFLIGGIFEPLNLKRRGYVKENKS
jgi:hypothetical protein